MRDMVSPHIMSWGLADLLQRRYHISAMESTSYTITCNPSMSSVLMWAYTYAISSSRKRNIFWVMARAEEAYLIQVHYTQARGIEVGPAPYRISPMVRETRIPRHAESPLENGVHEKGHQDIILDTLSLTSLLLHG